MDESTGITNTAGLVIFIHAVDSNRDISNILKSWQHCEENIYGENDNQDTYNEIM